MKTLPLIRTTWKKLLIKEFKKAANLQGKITKSSF